MGDLRVYLCLQEGHSGARSLVFSGSAVCEVRFLCEFTCLRGCGSARDLQEHGCVPRTCVVYL